MIAPPQSGEAGVGEAGGPRNGGFDAELERSDRTRDLPVHDHARPAKSWARAVELHPQLALASSGAPPVSGSSAPDGTITAFVARLSTSGHARNRYQNGAWKVFSGDPRRVDQLVWLVRYCCGVSLRSEPLTLPATTDLVGASTVGCWDIRPKWLLQSLAREDSQHPRRQLFSRSNIAFFGKEDVSHPALVSGVNGSLCHLLRRLTKPNYADDDRRVAAEVLHRCLTLVQLDNVMRKAVQGQLEAYERAEQERETRSAQPILAPSTPTS